MKILTSSDNKKIQSRLLISKKAIEKNFSVAANIFFCLSNDGQGRLIKAVFQFDSFVLRPMCPCKLNIKLATLFKLCYVVLSSFENF